MSLPQEAADFRPLFSQRFVADDARCGGIRLFPPIWSLSHHKSGLQRFLHAWRCAADALYPQGHRFSAYTKVRGRTIPRLPAILTMLFLASVPAHAMPYLNVLNGGYISPCKRSTP